MSNIPESADIAVDDALYEIFFKVDKILQGGVWKDNNDDNRDDIDDGNDTHKEDDKEMEDNNNDNPTEDKERDGNSQQDAKMKDAEPQEPVDDAKLQNKATEIINRAVDNSLWELADKVLAEDDPVITEELVEEVHSDHHVSL
uniref:Uncharacterized protein n=1 Tax=Arundo donax TaxID=35708 RepID=A0A0A9B3Z9_ARUDO